MKKRGLYALILALAMLLSLASCGTGDKAPLTESSEENAAASVPEEAASTSASSAESEKNGDIMILYTSDVHCGVDQGFGYAGLQQIRDSLESEGYTTLLVDDGDSVQGEPIGTMTKGESVIDLMNELHYDVAIPGNHEFDYGMDQFFALTERAEFPYVSCNFNKEGTLLFEPYVIKEAAGKRLPLWVSPRLRP